MIEATQRAPGIFAERMTLDERRRMGRQLRAVARRESHGAWAPAADRVDPVALLEQQAATRIPELVPVRHGRMAVSPFTFYRGAALVMARDLADTPVSGIETQVCGDAHLLNFGVFATPERNVIFDINDFDETLRGPWEWDLKRLAASIEIAARDRGWDSDFRRDMVLQTVSRYRTQMAEFAEMGNLEVHYAAARESDVLALMTDGQALKQSHRLLKKARRRTSRGSQEKMTRMEHGHRRIIENPPVVVRVDTGGFHERMHRHWERYLDSLPEDRRYLLGQYRFIDMARRVVGVGSVGLHAYVVLLEGHDADDPLVLQFKQAQQSVIEADGRVNRFPEEGQRVVVGQRKMQAASDMFLGWMQVEGIGDFYWRQLRDMKGSVELGVVNRYGFQFYCQLCAWCLARAHASTGDRVQIAAYLGRSDRFAEAIADFAVAYADQTERDHAAMLTAIKQGRIDAVSGI